MKPVSIGIIGAGNVGSTAAFALMLKGYGSIFLFDINEKKSRGEVMDLCDGSQGRCAASQWKEIGRADIYVIAAGRAGWSRSRAELLDENSRICEPFFRRIAELNPQASVIVATNPSDELAELGRKYIKNVVASGFLLDSARAKAIFGSEVEISGTHSERRLVSRRSLKKDDVERFHGRAAEIIRLKGCTQWGVAVEITRLVDRLAEAGGPAAVQPEPGA